MFVGLVVVYELAVVCCCGLSVILFLTSHYIIHSQVCFIQLPGVIQ